MPSDPVAAARQAGSGLSAAAQFDAILLAAGESRRMGYPKPLLKLGSRTFIEILAAAMLQSAARLIVVIGAHADSVRVAIPADPRIAVVENPGYLYGQLSSIKAGLSHVGPDAAGVLIHLADHPMVRAETFAAVVDGYRRSGRPVAIARFQGRRGHPVLFARELFDELAAAPEGEGARVVVAADPARVAYVDVDDPGVLTDLDTPEDLDRAGLARPPR
ncbi:MAG: nucleotidyltransferase family protein [Candidatus Binataceae bacterium]